MISQALKGVMMNRRRGGAGDPFFANTVMLLHGSDFLDYSALGATASLVGTGVTLDSSVPNGAVGTSSFRVTAAANREFQFPACPEYRRISDYTLEFWIYFDAVPSNNLAMCSNFGTKFVQLLPDGIGGGNTQVQGYGATGGASGVLSAWHQYTCVFDSAAGRFAQWLDGVLSISALHTLITDASNQDMDVISALGTGGLHRMMEIRYTQGVARYNPTDPNIPLQAAPWPDF